MIELRTREVRERLPMTTLEGDIEYFDGAVVEVNGAEPGQVFNYVIRLPEDWRSRPWIVEQYLEVAERRCFHNAVTAALA